MENLNRFNQEDILNSFLNSYHSIMNYLRMIAAYPNEFYIYISKKAKDLNYSTLRISIIRKVVEDRDNSGHHLDLPTILPNELIIPAINGIRDDFRDNHEISYACISPDSKLQTLQNTHFKLLITISNDEELIEAMEYNKRINCNPNRFGNKNDALVLIKKENK